MRGRVLAAVSAGTVLVTGAFASTVVDGATSTRSTPVSRYSLAHGCYSLSTRDAHPAKIAPSVGPFRLQPATLGVYLLYGKKRQYLTDKSGALTPTATPNDASQWRMRGNAKKGFTLGNLITRKRIAVTLVRAKGCAVYPEAQVNGTGMPRRGPSPGATVKGTMEGHAHITAFELFGGEWHCGRPWSPFGAPYALPADCSSKQEGTNGAFETFLDFGGPTRPSDMQGWPKFRHWPAAGTLAEEGDYYTAVERAWKAGMRVFVTQLVDNEALCDVMTKKRNPCNDMESIRIQDRDLHWLQRYVDAQSGGPGKGWFRIVTDPFQARKVVNQGKLAVVEGAEVSRILGCGEQYNIPECDKSHIDAGLKEVWRMGIRTFFPIHEFDNAFGGTKMISGETGMIVNAGNRDKTGNFWAIHSCPAQVQDAEQVTPPPPTGPGADLLNGAFAPLLGGNPLPVYPPPPHCNIRGITDLGKYVVNRMIDRHLIIQTDHMSSKTADATVKIAEDRHYAGVTSAHCCNSPQLFGRTYSIGGYANPAASTGEGFVNRWKQYRAARKPGYTFGFGFGSDLNGLAHQPGPTEPEIKYPFKSYDGRVKFDRERWGERVFDYNKEGIANYGLYADWLEQVRKIGGRPVMDDMFRGAESYIQMWERAFGVPATHCRAAEKFSAKGLGSSVRLGATRPSTLFRAGQPASRPGRSYRYCVASGGKHRGTTSVVFDGHGRVALVASSAAGALAGGVGPGSAADALIGKAVEVVPQIWLANALKGGARYVYVVRGGKVTAAGVVTGVDASRLGRLSADVRSAGL